MDGKAAAAEEATSTQKSLSSCHDPGWNDPPKWAFSPGQSGGGTPTKRLLNKRVAFPLSSGSPLSTPGANQSPAGVLLPGKLPPTSHQPVPLTSAPHAPLLAPTPLSHSTGDAPAVDREQALTEATDNLETVISKKLESSSKKEEVRRRLDAMKTMWKEDKLKDAVYEKVLEISKALRNNDIEAADKIHVSLMMDHAALCNTWISGIRHIILELREKSSRERRSSAEQDTQPYLLPQSVENCENK